MTSTYPYRENGPLDEIEWLREIQTSAGPQEVGRNHHMGIWVTRRKGLRTYAPGEVEGMFGDDSVAGALLLESPARPWHYVTEPMRPLEGKPLILWIIAERIAAPPLLVPGIFDPVDEDGWEWIDDQDERYKSGASPGHVYAWQPAPEPPPIPRGPHV